MTFLAGIGLNLAGASEKRNAEDVSPKKESPSKQSPTKKNGGQQLDDVSRPQGSSKKFKIRKFDISPMKKERQEGPAAPQNISKTNQMKFESMMTQSFGLQTCQDIYPQFQATPLERSIGITEGFFGRKPRYYNIMNKSLNKLRQATNLITVKYDIDQSQFNSHINLPELYAEKIKKVES